MTARIDWSAVPLGVKLDREIAAMLGCSTAGVKCARVARGIPAPEGNSAKGRPRVRSATLRHATCKGCGAKFEYQHMTGDPRRVACTVSCTRKMGRESRRKVPEDFRLLYAMYWDRGMTTIEIGEHFNTDHAVVRKRMVDLGIPRRKMGPRKQVACMIAGCDEPPYKITHPGNGASYGRRCLLHWVAHRHHLASEYWFRVVRYKKRNMPAEEDLAIVIDRAVPAGLPPDIREEVTQEMALKILMSEVAVKDLADAVSVSIKHFFREYQDKFRTVSLDAPIGGDGNLTLRDLVGEDGRIVKRSVLAE